MQKPSNPPARDWSGLLLAIPAVLFLALYMSDSDFTPAKQALAVLFVVVLFLGTWQIAQQRKRPLQRVSRRVDDPPDRR